MISALRIIVRNPMSLLGLILVGLVYIWRKGGLDLDPRRPAGAGTADG